MLRNVHFKATQPCARFFMLNLDRTGSRTRSLMREKLVVNIASLFNSADCNIASSLFKSKMSGMYP